MYTLLYYGSRFADISVFQESSCGARSSPNLLTACVRRRIPSDENLHDLYKRLPADCAPYPRWSRYHHCHPDVFPVHHCHQLDPAEAPSCQRSPAARRHKCWPPEDEVGARTHAQSVVTRKQPLKASAEQNT